MFAPLVAKLAWAVISGATLLVGSRAEAGCGCDKPPPPPANVRPAFASPGGTITLFGAKLDAGKTYKVRFQRSGTGTNQVVSAVAVLQRDLADGVVKPQLSVTVPPLPPGPALIRVTPDADTVLDISDSAFTVLQARIKLDESDGETVAKCYRAAVGADGRLYIPVNIAAISQRMIFSGIAKKFPLLFTASDVTIYNTQGFLMHLLRPDEAGVLFSITDPGSPNSLELTYDRHEFVTYKDQHVHVGNLALDPNDPAWHVDGTRHVDHNNLVIAIQGRLESGGTLSVGQTPPFDLSIVTALATTSTPVTTRVIQWSSECSSGS